MSSSIKFAVLGQTLGVALASLRAHCYFHFLDKED